MCQKVTTMTVAKNYDSVQKQFDAKLYNATTVSRMYVCMNEWNLNRKKKHTTFIYFLSD